MAKQTQPQRGKAPPPPPPRRSAPPPPKAQPQRQAAPPQRQATPPQREAAQQARGTAVAVKTNAAMSTEFAQAMGEHASGAGLSQDAADNLVPLVRVLQKLSPQVEPNKQEYIEGAVAGMIYLKGMEDPLVSGEEGIIVQPCSFEKWCTEWVPRDSGGGLVGRYKMEIGESVEQALDRHGIIFERVKDPKNNKRQKLVTPNGNELIESREFACRVIGEGGRRMQFLVPMSGSNHSVGRGWMVTMNSKAMNGNRLNSYTSLYRLTTAWTSNDQGDWYKYAVEDLGRLDQCQEAGIIDDWQTELAEGKALHDAFASGAKVADTTDYADDRADGGDSVGGGEGQSETPF